VPKLQSNFILSSGIASQCYIYTQLCCACTAMNRGVTSVI